eukprot:CAMPEP_0194061736 /NCGR_PEP_ID=MMETSP0009_2-20130614/75441_1 /TAXON_ID=210454 /ORGANISM="Grammatophora oceanica, Strain CCMP 410" /LENGTH=217 /DNA_ID=CAMNT_0038713177 /DNA_START=144 /DNA_END=793 /DNA_ORIENTATION=-
MTGAAAAPTTQKIARNEDEEEGGDEKNDKTDEILIESLTEKHFDAARKIENEFLGGGKGFCFGLCPYTLCPMGRGEFEGVYRKSSDRCLTYGLAIQQHDQSRVVGICKVRDSTQPVGFGENALHKPKEGEMYLDTMVVTKEARGRGVGTQLMNWAEDTARSRGRTKMTLGVVNGNPAQRLYERKGYIQVDSVWFLSSFMLGRPNGAFGAILMEKQLV